MADLSFETDFQLVPPTDSREAIIRACIKCWFEKNPSGKNNWGDCSGFLKSVQRELCLEPFKGRASDIADEVYARADWNVLGVGGASCLQDVERAVDAGRLVIAVWKAPDGGTGHVAIITLKNEFAGSKPEQQMMGS